MYKLFADLFFYVSTFGLSELYVRNTNMDSDNQLIYYISLLVFAFIIYMGKIYKCKNNKKNKKK